jgi:hypothetical protein
MFERLRLEAELARWRRAGRGAQFWWRDDDAQRLTPALVRLLDQAKQAGTPLTLAVVPVGCDPDLATHLRDRSDVTIAQHGVDHCNASSADRPSQFDDSTPVEAVALAIQAGAVALEDFRRVLPIYVPPWNAVQPNVQAALEWLSIGGLSAFGQAASPSRIDAHIDLMRWGARPRFLGRQRFFRRLRRLLQDRRRAGHWAEPIGLLTHHLAHDEPAWRFLRALLDWAPLRQTVQWRSAGELFCVTAASHGVTRLARATEPMAPAVQTA